MWNKWGINTWRICFHEPNSAFRNQSIHAVPPMLEVKCKSGWPSPAPVVVWGHVTCSGQLTVDRCAVCTFGPVKGPACRPHVRSQGETVFQTVSALSAWFWGEGEAAESPWDLQWTCKVGEKALCSLALSRGECLFLQRSLATLTDTQLPEVPSTHDSALMQRDPCEHFPKCCKPCSKSLSVLCWPF